MNSKLQEIEEIRYLNPIYEFIKVDNNKREAKKSDKGITTYPLTDLLENPKEWHALCVSTSRDLKEAKELYEEWDILELYNYITVQRAVNYEEEPDE